MSSFVEKVQSRRIDGKYSLVRKIGEGGYGMVYLGENFDTGAQVALKLEHRELEGSFLANEYENYALLQHDVGFPQVQCYKQQDDYKCLVLELLGPSLEDLLVYCGRKFSLKTTLMLLDQMLQRFETLHSKGLIHRDVKPDNFLMGPKGNGNIVYMTDFGLVHVLWPTDPEDTSLPVRRPTMIGTPRFASIRAHQGRLQTRWSDLEALGYVIIYFLLGQLPWQGLDVDNTAEKSLVIMELKKEYVATDLGRDLPKEFSQYMEIVTTSPPNEVPDYTKLRKMFHSLAKSKEIEYDNVFDWTIRMYLSNAGRE